MASPKQVALLYLMLLQHNSVTSEICLDTLRLSFTVKFTHDKKNISVGTILVFSLFPLAKNSEIHYTKIGFTICVLVNCL